METELENNWLQQNMSQEHHGAEIAGAIDLERARELCPFLGKMSLEDAAFFMELGAMGDEAMSSSQSTQTEVPQEAKETDSWLDKALNSDTDTHSKLEPGDDQLERLQILIDRNDIRVEEVIKSPISIAETNSFPGDMQEATFIQTEPEEPKKKPRSQPKNVSKVIVPLLTKKDTVTQRAEPVKKSIKKQAAGPILPLSSKKPHHTPKKHVATKITKKVEQIQEQAAATVLPMQEEVPAIEPEVHSEKLEQHVAREQVTHEVIQAFDPIPQQEVSQAETYEETPEESIKKTLHELFDEDVVEQEVITQVTALVEEMIASSDKAAFVHENMEVYEQMSLETEDQLQTLVMQILQEADISFTPAQVQTIVARIKKTIEAHKVINEPFENDMIKRVLPKEIGTREFLQKLHHQRYPHGLVRLHRHGKLGYWVVYMANPNLLQNLAA